MSLPQLQMRRPNLDDLPMILPGPGVRARLAKLEDAEAVALVLKGSFANMEWTPEKVREELLENDTVWATFLVEVEGRPAATASAAKHASFPGSGYVHWVGADPFIQGRGIGRLASLLVLHDFASRGLEDAVLHTDDERIPALKTYLRLGFLPDMTHESHAARWEDVKAKTGPWEDL